MNVAAGGVPYAIGKEKRGLFHMRCIRFGKLAASHERRDGEQIYRAMVSLAQLPSKPLSVNARRTGRKAQ
jgi:hypothetical protein